MKIRFDTLGLGVSMALIALVTPTMADEWNKETKLEFSAPVEVPGKVLTAGKYVFKIADSESNRNIVEIFSEDANGNQKLVTTILAIPEYREETPDKPVVQFEERSSGSPEAIHSWFYPGENTGWAFVYPKTEQSQMSSNTTAPEAAPALPEAQPADAPALAAALEPLVESEEPSEPEGSVTATEEDDVAITAQNDTPELIPAPDNDGFAFADRTLPETAGHSGRDLMTGLAMSGCGIAFVFASRSKSLA